MKNNVLFLLTLVFTLSLSLHAQRGVRIGYIDTEYILENVPEYQEAMGQLNEKAQKWKNEIQGKLANIAQKRKDLSNEKVLLTQELIEEREEDIAFEEAEILDYQQKRFGPNGDLMIQKKQLMQPIQDQIFAAVQDMAAGINLDGATLDNAKDGFTVHNVSANWSPDSIEGLTVIFGIDNLFDEYYASQSSRTGTSFHPRFGSLYLLDYEPGRNIKATMSYQF